jgi:hypothetical protein
MSLVRCQLNHVIHVRSWNSYHLCNLGQILSFMSNHVIHGKSCNSNQIILNHVKSSEIMWNQVKSCHYSCCHSCHLCSVVILCGIVGIFNKVWWEGWVWSKSAFTAFGRPLVCRPKAKKTVSSIVFALRPGRTYGPDTPLLSIRTPLDLVVLRQLCCKTLSNSISVNQSMQEPSGRNVQRVKLFLPFSSKCNLGWSWIVIFRGRNDDVIFLFSGAATQRRTRPYPKEGIHQILPNENKKFTLHRVVCFFYQNKSDSQIKPQCYWKAPH